MANLNFFELPHVEKDLFYEIDQRNRRYDAIKNTLTPQDAIRASKLAQTYPNFTPDMISSLSLLKMQPEDQTLQLLAERYEQIKQDEGFFKSYVRDPFTALIRGSLMGLEDFYRTFVDRPINAAIASTSGDQAENVSFWEAYSQSGKSTVKQAVQNLAQGRRVNIGSGIIPNSEVLNPQDPNSPNFEEYQFLVSRGIQPTEAQTIINNKLGNPITEIDRNMQEGNPIFKYTTKGGNQVPISLGRVAAAQVVEPNQQSFNVLSGLIDGAKAVFLDPANYVLAGAGAGLKAKKAFKPTERLMAQLKKQDKLTDIQKSVLGLNDNGIAKWFRREDVSEWLDGKTGDKFMEWLVDMENVSDFMDITGIKHPTVVKRLTDITKSNITREEKKVKLYEAMEYIFGNPRLKTAGVDVKPTAGTISRGVGKLVGKTLDPENREIAELFGATTAIVRKARNSNTRSWRIMGTYASELPYRFLDVDHMEDTFESVKAWLDNTTLDASAKDTVLSEFLTLKAGDYEGVFAATKNMMTQTIDDLIANHGADPEAARKFGQIFEEADLNTMRKYFTYANSGEQVLTPGMDLRIASLTEDGGTKVRKPLPRPQLLTELINRNIALPDPTELSKTISYIGTLKNKLPEGFGAGTDITGKLMDKYYTQFWKPFVLLRGAWTVRVISEEQLRLWARGYKGIASNPLSWIALKVAGLGGADAAKVRRWTAKNVTFKDIKGDILKESDEWKRASSRAFGGEANQVFNVKGRRVRFRGGPRNYSTITKTQFMDEEGNITDTRKFNRYIEGYLNELRKLEYDDMFKFLFRNKQGKDEFEMAKVFADKADSYVDELLEAWNKGGAEYELASSTRAGRQAIAEALIARVHMNVGGGFTVDEDLLYRALKGEIDDSVITGPMYRLENIEDSENATIALPSLLNMMRTGKTKIVKSKEGDLLEQPLTLREIFDSPEKHYESLIDFIGDPFNVIHLPDYVAVPKADMIDDVSFYQKAISNMFNMFMGERTDNMSRSPVFRQAYWRAIYDLLPSMTKEMRDLILNGGRIKKSVDSDELVTWTGAYSANIPEANLLENIIGDLRQAAGEKGVGIKFFRDKDTRINLQMIEQRIKKLNDADLASGVDFNKDIQRLLKEAQDDFNNSYKILKDKLAKLDTDLKEGTITKKIYDRDSKTINNSIQNLRKNLAAEKFNLNKDAANRLDINELTEIDDVAKAYALDEVQNLLYDLSTRKKLAYNLRSIFPFGEAFIEIMTTWGGLLKNNPELLRRGQVVVENLREDNELSPVQGQGFFATDEITGEEVFNVPIVGESISNIAFGRDRNVRLRLAGYASALNLIMSFKPGIGPTVQIPAAFIAEMSPKFDDVVEGLFEYGLPNVDTPADLVAAAGVPGYLKSFVQALYMDSNKNQGELMRVAGNTIIDAFTVLEANGMDTTTRAGQQDTMEQAVNVARGMTFIKALSQWVGPTSLNVRYDIGDPRNADNFISKQSLADYYREILQTPPQDKQGNFLFTPGDNHEATKYFITTFGFNPLSLITPKTQVIEPRPVDERGVAWQEENPELFESHSLTAQYAIPSGGGGEFSYEAYIRNLRSGKRQTLNAEQWLYIRNQRLGSYYVENLRRNSLETFDITDPRQARARNQFLAISDDEARVRFPGYGSPIPGVMQSAGTEQAVDELKTWDQNAKLSGTDTGKGLDIFFSEVTRLEQKSLAAGLTKDGWRSSRQFFRERQQLRETVSGIINKYPDFYLVYERVLNNWFSEPVRFLEDLQYDQEVMEQYGYMLPTEEV